MGADSDCYVMQGFPGGKLVLQTCGSTLVPPGVSANTWSGVVVVFDQALVGWLDLKLFIPRYSGRDPSFLGLVIVIGPVDCVDNGHLCRWIACRPVHHRWTKAVDNSACLWMKRGCPQAIVSQRVVTHRLRASHAQVVLRRCTGGWERHRTPVHRVIPRLWTGEVSGRDPAGYGRVTPTPPVWITLWATLWANPVAWLAKAVSGTGCGSGWSAR